MDSGPSCSAQAHEPVVVRSAAAAQLLLDPDARRVLKPFFGSGATVTQAARALGLKPNTLLRQVQRLVALGLLHVSGEERRAGRAIKHYRVTGEDFFVPFHVTDALTLEDLLMRAVEEPNRLIARSLARLCGAQSPRLGYLVTRLPSGRIAHDLSLDGAAAAAPLAMERPWLRDGRTLRLTQGRAREFMRELGALLDRYDDPAGDPHLAFVAVAPLR
ncbi:hypothetical protein DEIPH_ctg002orf0086 [Deinococcus phoenicis]|uniref:Uncharacterized protein n=1 Tax=Deinococcus phoenicis TaxID=1476583 RepID=A0A016QV52_9DEIO|nr:helix-turn-helix domain-containing protein [Deinococcus phoenicis]EYB69757.1 hypothetical protein DEIPH_ctg002orf0086 [Deinococcus phoenicis]